MTPKRSDAEALTPERGDTAANDARAVTARALRVLRSMRWTCHFVPALVCASILSLSGCYVSHEGGGDCLRPPGVCCGFDRVVPFEGCVCPRGSFLQPGPSFCVPTPVPIDAGPFIDAGPIVDAGPLMCPLVRADVACMRELAATPGVPFTLPLTFDACGCCVQSECRAELRGDTLHLTTTLCPDPCDCDRCVLPEVDCAIPPLAEGVYEVVVNGAPAFSLPVIADSGLVPPPPACQRFAQEDMCRLSDRLPDVSGWRPSSVCVETRSATTRSGNEPVVVRVQSDCWGCGDLMGPCVAIVEPRFTDDLPPGGEIRVQPTHFPTVCDVDCPAVCIEAEVDCFVPPLEDGDFYRVWLDGEAVLGFTAGDLGGACTASPPPPPG